MSMTESTGVGTEGFGGHASDPGGANEWEHHGSQERWSGRMPPQDVDADQSVLGSMLLS